MIQRTERDSILILEVAHGPVNALDVDLCEDLVAALSEARESAARAVVLTGTQGVFSAGVNLYRVIEGRREYLTRFIPVLSEAFGVLFTMPLPVVAAVNGHAIAGGCVLASACDQRVMARGSARIGIPELKVGAPFPLLALEIMRFALPAHQFQHAVYTGETWLPSQALARGLVDELVEPELLLERSCELAGQLARIPAATFRVSKLAMRRPVLERIERTADDVDAEVQQIWAEPTTWEHIRDYMERTVGRRQ